MHFSAYPKSYNHSLSVTVYLKDMTKYRLGPQRTITKIAKDHKDISHARITATHIHDVPRCCLEPPILL